LSSRACIGTKGENADEPSGENDLDRVY